jgi:hypothetical protein
MRRENPNFFFYVWLSWLEIKENNNICLQYIIEHFFFKYETSEMSDSERK